MRLGLLLHQLLPATGQCAILVGGTATILLDWLSNVPTLPGYLDFQPAIRTVIDVPFLHFMTIGHTS